MRKLLLLSIAGAVLQAAPVRVLIFSGHNNHDWRTTTPYLAKLLKDSGRFDVRLEQEPAGITAATLANCDLIVLDYQGRRWGAEAEKAVLDFVRGGKGIVAVHGASYSFSGLDVLGDGHVRTGIFEPPWKEYIAMVGATWSKEKPESGHAPRHIFTVKLTDREHPVLRGMPETFHTSDELYHNLRMQPGVKVIATAWDDPKNGGTGKDEPMLWTVDYGKGRMFHTALGHDVAAMQEPGFAISFVRGCEWAATGEVTLPAKFPDIREHKAGMPSLRVEVITGGHGFDPEFYSVFTGWPDMRATTTGHPDAYKRKIDGEADVLVLYDSVADLPEDRKGNLKAFVESGHGVVVLHHGIVDFDEWPWWYDEVVGGKYLMKPWNGMPGSTYKHDEDVHVRVAAEHPITRGMSPMHLTDETYKGMWVSPKVKVLLTTDNPTSDGPVAWVSPYGKARVVYIQLGHDRLANENPLYRELVHRAVMWVGGRLE